jgi:hypothetical protein
MKRLFAFFFSACLLGGLASGQEMPSNYQHIKCYDQLIGTWEHAGPSTESVEGLLEKGDPIRLRLRMRWIVEKNAVETDLTAEIVNSGFTFRSRGMIGWDPAAKQIVEGAMNSIGGSNHAMVTYDPDKKTFTSINKGVDGQGEPVTSRTILTVKDKDTITIQGLDRKGGLLEGDGAVLTYKRVARGKGGRKRKQAKE